MKEEPSDVTHTTADKIFPIREMRRTCLRPYLSDNAPIVGDTMNCSVLSCMLEDIIHDSSSTHENTEPISPPTKFE